jgi:hypothetical protein
MAVTKHKITLADVGTDIVSFWSIKNALLTHMETERDRTRRRRVSEGWVTMGEGEILLEVHGKATAAEIAAEVIALKGTLWW